MCQASLDTRVGVFWLRPGGPCNLAISASRAPALALAGSEVGTNQGGTVLRSHPALVLTYERTMVKVIYKFL